MGIQIVGLDTGEYLIGQVSIDDMNNTLMIKNPFGIESVNDDQKSTKTKKTYKICFFTYSEFSKNEYITINSNRWVDMVVPSPNLKQEYIRISKSVEGIRDDFTGLDDEINEFDLGHSFDGTPEEITPEITREFPPPIKKNAKRKKREKRNIRNRWIDNN